MKRFLALLVLTILVMGLCVISETETARMDTETISLPSGLDVEITIKFQKYDYASKIFVSMAENFGAGTPERDVEEEIATLAREIYRIYNIENP